MVRCPCTSLARRRQSRVSRQLTPRRHATVFPSHILPAPASSHQPGNSIFLSQFQPPAPAEHSGCNKRSSRLLSLPVSIAAHLLHQPFHERDLSSLIASHDLMISVAATLLVRGGERAIRGVACEDRQGSVVRAAIPPRRIRVRCPNSHGNLDI